MADPTDIFIFMHSNHIGDGLALFYMAWALVVEGKRNFSLADKIFKRGIERCGNAVAFPLGAAARRPSKTIRRVFVS